MTKKIVPRPKRARTKSKRRQLADFHDMLRVELIHAKAITMTAVLALEGNGVNDQVSIALRGSVRRIQIALSSLQEEIGDGVNVGRYGEGSSHE